MEPSARVFSLGDEAKLNSLFEAGDFRDVEITTERHRFVLPPFDAYFEPFEQGAGSPGQRRQIHRRSRRRKNRDVLEVVNDYLMGRCRRSAVGLLITGASRGRRRVQVNSIKLASRKNTPRRFYAHHRGTGYGISDGSVPR